MTWCRPPQRMRMTQQGCWQCSSHSCSASTRRSLHRKHPRITGQPRRSQWKGRCFSRRRLAATNCLCWGHGIQFTCNLCVFRLMGQSQSWIQVSRTCNLLLFRRIRRQEEGKSGASMPKSEYEMAPTRRACSSRAIAVNGQAVAPSRSLIRTQQETGHTHWSTWCFMECTTIRLASRYVRRWRMLPITTPPTREGGSNAGPEAAIGGRDRPRMPCGHACDFEILLSWLGVPSAQCPMPCSPIISFIPVVTSSRPICVAASLICITALEPTRLSLYLSV